MKKYCAFLLLFCLLCISGTALAQTSGTCGENEAIDWTLENGTITFNGNGDHPTWNSTCKDVITSNVTKVVIGDKVFAPENASEMFANLYSVQEMILRNLDVSQTTNMSIASSAFICVTVYLFTTTSAEPGVVN